MCLLNYFFMCGLKIINEPKQEPIVTEINPNKIKIITSLKNAIYKFFSRYKNNSNNQELKVVNEPARLNPKSNFKFFSIFNLLTKPNKKHPAILIQKI